ncbi:MAG: hypothetical protein M3Z01_07835 [Thermoproteota archaeon]|nr:hypothetical protein [Thermoproteota archaeon]
MLKSLEKMGLAEADMQFVNVPIQHKSGELQKVEIFAGYSNTPFISDEVKKGFKTISSGIYVPGTITNILAFHSDIVKQRPLNVQNIIKSIIDAKTYFDKNKERDIRIISIKSGLSI